MKTFSHNRRPLFRAVLLAAVWMMTAGFAVSVVGQDAAPVDPNSVVDLTKTNPKFADPFPATKLKALREKLPAAVATEIARLPDKAKAAIQKAAAAEPFASQHKNLLGIWHGSYRDESADTRSHWVYQRNENGSVRQLGISLMANEKEYVRLDRSSVWMTKGRVLFEQDAADEDELVIFVIDQLDDQTVEYRIVLEPEDDHGEVVWSAEKDLRGDIDVPKPPIGWTNVSE